MLACMNVPPKLVLGFWNAWLLCVPMVIVGMLAVLPHKQVARRLSDMTGYGARERLFTVTASLLPYAFMAISAWTPLLSFGPWLVVGVLVSLAGTAGFLGTLGVFGRAPVDELILAGPYRFSRNPLYVSAHCSHRRSGLWIWSGQAPACVGGRPPSQQRATGERRRPMRLDRGTLLGWWSLPDRRCQDESGANRVAAMQARLRCR